jgi:hypothetical protein
LRTAKENHVKLMKERLFSAMKATGKEKFNTELFSFSIQKSGGKLPVIIDDEVVPIEYQKAKWENDNELIREALESGKQLPFAHLGERGETLRIR